MSRRPKRRMPVSVVPLLSADRGSTAELRSAGIKPISKALATAVIPAKAKILKSTGSSVLMGNVKAGREATSARPSQNDRRTPPRHPVSATRSDSTRRMRPSAERLAPSESLNANSLWRSDACAKRTFDRLAQATRSVRPEIINRPVLKPTAGPRRALPRSPIGASRISIPSFESG